MKRSRLIILAAASFFNVLCLMACAQEHTANEKKLSVANSISKSTVLLNNQETIVPLKSLAKKNIASVSLSFAYSSVFDSLANKYDKITSFSADSFKDSVNLNDLEDDLKYFNTILISIDDQNINKAKYISFINS
ncbi:MAG: beta-N-acetylglucosaminidase, partial [Sphingobacteriales bacterium]